MLNVFCLFLSFLLIIIPTSIAETSTPNTGDQAQAFLFSYTTSNLVLPVTATCPTPLILTQLTPTNAHTSDPAAPYTMVMLVHEQLVDSAGKKYERVYSASMGVGDLSSTQEINHPLGNGTQFIGCIWGSNQVSGGCQDLYTVVPSERTADAYQYSWSTCRASDVLESWVTPSNQTLDVGVSGVSGDVSINAWPAACSDLQFTPKNGTPPYTLLIAPAAHPPVNITSATKAPMNYTIRLTHGQAFMVGMYDSVGNSWAFGPLHSGDASDLSCLAVATGQEVPKKGSGDFGIGALTGGVIAAFLIGAAGATIVMWYLGKRRKGRTPHSESTIDLYNNPRPESYRTTSGSTFPKTQGYTDQSPTLDFDTPGTLYDPHFPGPTAGYPKAPSVQQRTVSADRVLQGTSPSPNASSAGFTKPYDQSSGISADSYRDNIGMMDFGPTMATATTTTTPRGRPRSISDRSSRSTGESPGYGPDPAWGSARRSAGHGARVGGSPELTPTPVHPSMGRRIPSSPRPSPFQPVINTNAVPKRGDDETPSSPSSPSRPRNVYVVHSDGGSGDVHIQLPDPDTRVIELPPGYQPMTMPEPSTTRSRQDRASMPPSKPQTQAQRGTGRWSGVNRDTGTGTGTGMGQEELRARAEAAMQEKRRPMSG
ncbi:hypothetical protein CI109_105998 [Kwoniella shandongensis]|uniref:Uncharacterized protein n=1 Tax=Kwoniella shandongensis TaxID=1734106 RepID=A0A5M6C276_9TREE|nr:uncharacterized protein CI109_003954 [Kwoniella shandongensis]KAA5527695.1 hypothetical protein CI109_003954 [Kwoniella shandongensis]